MDIHFHCFQCGQKLSVDSAGAGSEVNCPSCQTALVVPCAEPSRSSVTVLRRLPRASLWIAVALAVMAGVWFFFTPHLAVRGMMKAAEARDAEGISERVDFPAFRATIKGNFNAIMAKELAAPKEKATGFEALGAAFASVFADKFVDALVTPEAVAMMMQGEKPMEKREGKADGPERPKKEMETAMGYRSLSKFVVKTREKGSSDAATELIFTRYGLASWKLSGLALPAESKPAKAMAREL